MQLDRHDRRLHRVDQHDIDEPPRRSTRGNFDEPLPAWVGSAKDCLADRSLEAVVDAGTGVRVQMDAEVRPEHPSDRDEHREAGLANASLDLAEISVVDASRRSHGPSR
ncbi:MAG TPA: hypothetical protein VFO05_11805 [Candidatus Limnocylindrales bacterium]|nr:hypothetical protein [Candidatus Limnocylindrales bacterium]